MRSRLTSRPSAPIFFPSINHVTRELPHCIEPHRSTLDEKFVKPGLLYDEYYNPTVDLTAAYGVSPPDTAEASGVELVRYMDTHRLFT